MKNILINSNKNPSSNTRALTNQIGETILFNLLTKLKKKSYTNCNNILKKVNTFCVKNNIIFSSLTNILSNNVIQISLLFESNTDKYKYDYSYFNDKETDLLIEESLLTFLNVDRVKYYENKTSSKTIKKSSDNTIDKIKDFNTDDKIDFIEPDVVETINDPLDDEVILNWICKDVLPTIRKEGNYSLANLPDNISEERALEALDRYLSLEERGLIDEDSNKASREDYLESLKYLVEKVSESDELVQKYGFDQALDIYADSFNIKKNDTKLEKKSEKTLDSYYFLDNFTDSYSNTFPVIEELEDIELKPNYYEIDFDGSYIVYNPNKPLSEERERYEEIDEEAYDIRDEKRRYEDLEFSETIDARKKAWFIFYGDDPDYYDYFPLFERYESDCCIDFTQGKPIYSEGTRLVLRPEDFFIFEVTKNPNVRVAIAEKTYDEYLDDYFEERERNGLPPF